MYRSLLPSPYLTKKAQRSKRRLEPKAIVYDRDIMCLPKYYGSDRSTIKIPRGAQVREFMGKNGLIRKIRLTSNMTESDIIREISSVFSVPMGGREDFSFTVLQPTGGSSKSLNMPALSSSFKWTASAISGKNNKSPIYILANDDLKVSMEIQKV